MFIESIREEILSNKEKSIKIAAVSLVIIIALIVYLSNGLTKSENIVVLTPDIAESFDEEPVIAVTAVKEMYIVVDVAGAVNYPGVFSLPDGSRVNDAVEKAGGLADGADTMGVNLAARLSDGDKVYIPRSGEDTKPAGVITSSVSGTTQTSAGDTGGALVNINTANSEQLQALSGVGPVIAQKIIDYRESSGGFKKVEDIMKVSGIGTKTFQKFKDKISV